MLPSRDTRVVTLTRVTITPIPKNVSGMEQFLSAPLSMLPAPALEDGVAHATTSTEQCRPTRRAQWRQRAEIARLRFQAADLESHVALLRRFCTVSSSSDEDQGDEDHDGRGAMAGRTEGTREWFTRAAAELTARQQAEQQNRRLRAALDEQLKMREELEQLLQHTLSPQVRSGRQ